MRRMLAKWMISRSLDSGRAIPRWVRGWLVDDESARFEASARRLAASLTRDATAWRSIHPTAGRQQETAARSDQRSATPLMRRRLTIGATGCCLLAIALIARPLVVTPADRAAATTAKVKRIFAAVDDGWTTVENAAARLEAAASRPFTPSAVKSPTTAFKQATGAATNRALDVFNDFNDRMRVQRSTIDSQFNAAMSFFVYRLPSTTTKLVGLSPGVATAEPKSL